MAHHPITPHLIELRQRVYKILIVQLIIFCPLLYFAGALYTLVATPLINLLPNNSSLIATHVTASFMVPLKLVFILSILLVMPYILFQIWAFIAPGLYSNEKRFFKKLLLGSTSLFYTGLLFSFFVVSPLALSLFTSITPKGVQMMTEMGNYLDFIVVLGFAFGFAFQVPLIMLILIKINLFSVEKMRANRPYVIVGAFIVGMLLTPPDVVSQILLALPLWGLFELGLWWHKK